MDSHGFESGVEYRLRQDTRRSPKGVRNAANTAGNVPYAAGTGNRPGMALQPNLGIPTERHYRHDSDPVGRVIGIRSRLRTHLTSGQGTL